LLLCPHPLSVSLSLRAHIPKLSLDYLEDELTSFYQVASNAQHRQPVEFRPAAEEHLRKLEAHRLSQLEAVAQIFDTHLGALVHTLLEVPLGDMDLELVRELIVTMSDYVERQFPKLSSRSILRFYESLLRCVIALTLRLQDTETTAAHIPVMVAMLNLLDSLATQEFCVSSIVVSEEFLGSDLLAREELPISEVVGVSLLLFSRVWTEETLEHYCELQKAYYSLLLYTLSSASDFLLWSGQSSSTAKLFLAIGMAEEEVLRSLSSVYSVLIWGISSLYHSTPRLAMQGIQHCAIVGIKSKGATDASMDLLSRFLWHCQDTFLFFLGNKFSPSSASSPSSSSGGSSGDSADQKKKSNGISWERVDAISSTLLSVIAFDVQRSAPSRLRLRLTLRQVRGPGHPSLPQQLHQGCSFPRGSLTALPAAGHRAWHQPR
jgi:hypothetical protein